MDIQMPVMDGMESTDNIMKIIRAKYGPKSIFKSSDNKKDLKIVVEECKQLDQRQERNW